jgi:hypothetical protein
VNKTLWLAQIYYCQVLSNLLHLSLLCCELLLKSSNAHVQTCISLKNNVRKWKVEVEMEMDVDAVERGVEDRGGSW